jgi:hypothetical protein
LQTYTANRDTICCSGSVGSLDIGRAVNKRPDYNCLCLYCGVVSSYFVTATKALQTFPAEFSTLLTELANYISSLDNYNLSIMRLSFKSGAILLVAGFVTFMVLSFFRFYQMQYDGEIFRYVVYSDVGTKARKQPAQAE